MPSQTIDRTTAPRLSVVIPIYNEAATLEEVVSRVRQLAGDCEVVLVDDGSDDGTSAIVQESSQFPGVVAIRHPHNRGKGAAVQSGIAVARGEIIVIQDADLEYDPQTIEQLVEPIAGGQADVVFGSRFLQPENAWGSASQRIANCLLTRLSNWVNGLELTDMETCQKAFRREILAGLVLHEAGFGVEPELTAKIAAGNWRIQEIPISYHARSRTDGKKIGFADGIWAIWCIIRYGSSRFLARATPRRPTRRL